MSRQRARIEKAEQQLKPKIPPKIIVIWPGQEPSPEQPGENRILFRVVYQDSPPMEL